MSVKAELSKLVEQAEQALDGADHMARNERNRLSDAVAVLRSAIASTQEPEPAKPAGKQPAK